MGPDKERYIQSYIDEDSGFVGLYPCRAATAEAGVLNLTHFEALLQELTADPTLKVSAVKSDSHNVYTDAEFAAHCRAAGRLQAFSAPYVHQQNGKAERMWRTMETAVSSMFAYSGLPLHFWPLAVNNFAHTHNRTCASGRIDTPYERLTSRQPDISNLRVWGCPTKSLLEKDEHKKFESKVRHGFNLGNNGRTTDAWWIYFPDTHNILTRRDTTHDEFWRMRAEYFHDISLTLPDGSTPFPPTPPDPVSTINEPVDSFPLPYTPTEQAPDPAREHTPEPVLPALQPITPGGPYPPPRPPPSPSPSPSPSSPAATPSPRASPQYSLPPDGDNTNIENTRFVPVTLANDVQEIASISRTSIHAATGQTRYLTVWHNSFNITAAAIAARRRGNFIPKNPPRVSIYDQRNFDVEWQDTIEPPSTFLTPDGSYLPVYTDFLAAPTRRARVSMTPHARLSHVYHAASNAQLDTAADTNKLFHDHIHQPNTLRYDDPHLSTNAYFSSFFKNGAPQKTAYAFLSIQLPHGSTPKSRKDAFRSVDKKHWVFALDSEYQQLLDALTWTLVPAGVAPNVISGKWVFKIKHNADGTIDRYKARWVARGFSQKIDVDYTEIFAPVIRYSSVRLLLSLANAYDLNAYGLDVSNAFARADADELLFVEQPHGYEQYDANGDPYVCKLDKCLYGTKQAARMWHRKFRAHLDSNGWKQLESDPCIFTRTTAEFGTEFIGLYVDDIIHLAAHPDAHAHLLAMCNSEFPTTTQGELAFILGMRVSRDRATRTLYLDQTQAIFTYLDSIGLSDAKPISTPMDPDWKYGSSPISPIDPDRHYQYRSQVGSLSYFNQCTRPDIAYAVHCLSRHLSDPNDNCFAALDRLNRYIATTPHLGLRYHVDPTAPLRLEHQIQTGFSPDETVVSAYADASFGGEDANQGRSHSGYAIYFGGGLIDWSSHVQSVIAQSSAEAEQIAAFTCSRSIVYYRNLLEELSLRMAASTIIYEDNEACIAQSKNPVNHKRSKHILLKYHYLRQLAEDKIVCLEYIQTTDQIADIFTNPLAPKLFQQLCPHITHSRRPR
jgi:hypothetical protein